MQGIGGLERVVEEVSTSWKFIFLKEYGADAHSGTNQASHIYFQVHNAILWALETAKNANFA